MVYTKTDAGRDEIQQRSRKLPAGLRSILLMVDGQRNTTELKELATALKAPEDALEQLLAQQLIALVAETASESVASTSVPPATPEDGMAAADSQRRTALYNLMTDAINAHLGLKGYFLQLKVDRCTDLAALMTLMPDISAALGKAKSDALAKRWLDSARSLLADTQVA